jgi:hypothetical protein
MLHENQTGVFLQQPKIEQLNMSASSFNFSSTNKCYFKHNTHYLIALFLTVILIVGCKPSPAINDQRVVTTEAQRAAEPKVIAVPDKAGLPTTNDMPVSSSILPAEACTLEGYWSFFEAFVQSQEVRKIYTSPQIQVRRYSDESAATSKQHDYFRIGLVDYQWVYLDDSKDESNYDRLDLEKTLKNKRFRVDYRKAEFDGDDELVKTFGEPGAYVFEFRDGCWNLTQDLR